MKKRKKKKPENLLASRVSVYQKGSVDNKIEKKKKNVGTKEQQQ